MCCVWFFFFRVFVGCDSWLLDGNLVVVGCCWIIFCVEFLVYIWFCIFCVFVILVLVIWLCCWRFCGLVYRLGWSYLCWCFLFIFVIGWWWLLGCWWIVGWSCWYWFSWLVCGLFRCVLDWCWKMFLLLIGLYWCGCVVVFDLVDIGWSWFWFSWRLVLGFFCSWWRCGICWIWFWFWCWFCLVLLFVGWILVFCVDCGWFWWCVGGCWWLFVWVWFLMVWWWICIWCVWWWSVCYDLMCWFGRVLVCVVVMVCRDGCWVFGSVCWYGGFCEFCLGCWRFFGDGCGVLCCFFNCFWRVCRVFVGICWYSCSGGCGWVGFVGWGCVCCFLGRRLLCFSWFGFWLGGLGLRVGGWRDRDVWRIVRWLGWSLGGELLWLLVWLVLVGCLLVFGWFGGLLCCYCCWVYCRCLVCWWWIVCWNGCVWVIVLGWFSILGFCIVRSGCVDVFRGWVIGGWYSLFWRCWDGFCVVWGFFGLFVYLVFCV